MKLHLISRNDVEKILGITDTDIPFALLEWAESETSRRTGKIYSTETETEVIYLRTSQKYINLKHTNILNVEYVKEDGNEIDVAAYNVYKEEGMIILVEPKGVSRLLFESEDFTKDLEIEIKYTYGNEAPTDIERKICFLILLKSLIRSKPELLKNLIKSGRNVIKERIGDYSVSYRLDDILTNKANLDSDIDDLVKLVKGELSDEVL